MNKNDSARTIYESFANKSEISIDVICYLLFYIQSDPSNKYDNLIILLAERLIYIINYWNSTPVAPLDLDPEHVNKGDTTRLKSGITSVLGFLHHATVKRPDTKLQNFAAALQTIHNSNDQLITFVKIRAGRTIRDPDPAKYNQIKILVGDSGSDLNMNVRYSGLGPVNTVQTRLVTNGQILQFRYDDAKDSFYDPGESVVHNPDESEDKQITTTLYNRNNKKPNYNHEFHLGPFTNIYNALQTNPDIMRSDIFNEKITKKLIEGDSPVCIIGYGASGSGKTSVLIRLDAPGVSEENGRGVLMLLSDKMADEKHVCCDVRITELGNVIESTGYKKVIKTNSFAGSYQRSIDKKWEITGIRTGENITTGKHFKFTSIGYTGDPEERCSENMFSDILFFMEFVRNIARTSNNKVSSRSHVIITLDYYAVDGYAGKKTLFICDLAGVENKFTCDNLNDTDPVDREKFYTTDRIMPGEINCGDKETYHEIARNGESDDTDTDTDTDRALRRNAAENRRDEASFASSPKNDTNNRSLGANMDGKHGPSNLNKDTNSNSLATSETKTSLNTGNNRSDSKSQRSVQPRQSDINPAAAVDGKYAIYLNDRLTIIKDNYQHPTIQQISKTNSIPTSWGITNAISAFNAKITSLNIPDNYIPLFKATQIIQALTDIQTASFMARNYRCPLGPYFYAIRTNVGSVAALAEVINELQVINIAPAGITAVSFNGLKPVYELGVKKAKLHVPCKLNFETVIDYSGCMSEILTTNRDDFKDIGSKKRKILGNKALRLVQSGEFDQYFTDKFSAVLSKNAAYANLSNDQKTLIIKYLIEWIKIEIGPYSNATQTSGAVYAALHNMRNNFNQADVLSKLNGELTAHIVNPENPKVREIMYPLSSQNVDSFMLTKNPTPDIKSVTINIQMEYQTIKVSTQNSSHTIIDVYKDDPTATIPLTLNVQSDATTIYQVNQTLENKTAIFFDGKCRATNPIPASTQVQYSAAVNVDTIADAILTKNPLLGSFIQTYDDLLSKLYELLKPPSTLENNKNLKLIGFVQYLKTRFLTPFENNEYNAYQLQVLLEQLLFDKTIQSVSNIVSELSKGYKIKDDNLDSRHGIGGGRGGRRLVNLYQQTKQVGGAEGELKIYCESRTKEGYFINQSLTDLRADIAKYVQKSQQGTKTTPSFFSKCLPIQCNPEFKECLGIDRFLNPADRESTDTHRYGDLMKVIQENCPVDKKEKIVFCVFCVINFAEPPAVAEPPPIPYIDITKLQQLYQILKNVKVESFRNPDGLFGEIKDELGPIKDKLSNKYPSIITAIDTVQTLNDEVMLILENIIKSISNINAGTPIGTLLFTDAVAKTFVDVPTCNVMKQVKPRGYINNSNPVTDSSRARTADADGDGTPPRTPAAQNNGGAIISKTSRPKYTRKLYK